MVRYLASLYNKYMEHWGYVRIDEGGRPIYVSREIKELRDMMLKTRDISELALPDEFAEQIRRIREE